MTQPHDPPTDPAPPAAPPHLEHFNEDLYQAAVTVLVEPNAASSPWAGLGCLAVSLVLFALSFAFGDHLATLAFIIPVLLLHEAGHFAGMRAFGYRNVYMFFIPFFGAAVSGKKHAAPAWQQVVVLLLGPLPGLALAAALQGALRPSQDIWVGDLVVWLAILNGVNLLPIVPLDGGRIVDVLFFARRPWPAVALRLLAGAALLGLAYLSWGGSRFEAGVLALMAVVVLLGAPLQYRRARLGRAFGHNPLGLPARLEELGDGQRRELFGWAALLNPLDRDPASLARDMRNLHENMVSRRPGALAWLGLVAAYLAGFAAAFAALALSFRDTQQQRREQAEALFARFHDTTAELAAMEREMATAPFPRRLTLEEAMPRRWRELVEEYRAAPAKVREQAVARLRAEARVALLVKMPGAARQQAEVSRLATDLGMPPTAE